MTLRRLLFWLHLSVGLVVGLLIAFLALTGSLISFQTQLVAFAERGIVASHPASAACVPPSTLLANAAAATPRPLTSLTLFADPHQPAQILTGTGGAVLLADPCTGHILGPGASRLRVALTAIRELHHQATFAGVHHETLRALKNAAALVFIFLALSGLYLWFPRRLTWQHLRPSLLFRRDLRGRAREWNLHNLAGFWLCLPLLAIAVTGTIMAYPWANALLFRAAGEAPPPSRRDAPPSPRPSRQDSAPHQHHAHPASPNRSSSSATEPSTTAVGASSNVRNAASGGVLASDGASPGIGATASARISPSGAAPTPFAPTLPPASATTTPTNFTALDLPIARARAFTPGISSVSLRLPAPGAQALTFQLTRFGRQPVLRDTLTLAPTDATVLKWEPLSAATRGRHWRLIVRFLHTGELFGAPGQAVALLSALGALLLVWTGISLALRRLAAFRSRRRNQPQPSTATTPDAHQPVQVS